MTVSSTLAPLPAAVSRSRLLAPNRGVGRELLRSRAVTDAGWIGIEIGTPESLAHDVIAIDLASERLAPVDDLDRRALIDEAIDQALEGVGAAFGDLREGVGFRDALANAVEALRLAGIDPAALRAAEVDDDAKQAALAEVLERFEAALREGRLVDSADLFRRAIAKLERDGAATDERLLLLPHLRTRGLSGRFVRLLTDGGAETLGWTPPAGLDLPAVLGDGGGEPPRLAFLHAIADAPPPVPTDPALELFAAGSVTDELREVLRRIVAAGRRWDDVEIVATDPVAYGCALDALATRLEIPVTYAVGLPIDRTRQGRAAAAYLQWIQEDFPAAILRQLLEAGDVRPPDDDAPWGDQLARRLRALRVGWGRDRYRETIDRRLQWLDQAPPEPGNEWRPAEELAESRARERGGAGHPPRAGRGRAGRHAARPRPAGPRRSPHLAGRARPGPPRPARVRAAPGAGRGRGARAAGPYPGKGIKTNSV